MPLSRWMTAGQNCIILFPGANRAVDEEFADRVLEAFGAEDHILLQNEISSLPYIIVRAWERGMKIILNPSPMDERLKECDLEKVWLFILNEVEGAQLTGMKEPEKILQEMRRRYPGARIVLTLGSDGSMYSEDGNTLRQEIFPAETVDTTGAGDTFTGYFITEYLASGDAAAALRSASMASSIAVSRKGAAEGGPGNGRGDKNAERTGESMKRNVDMREISDGRLYTAEDMVRADCHDCQGCSACCSDMGDSVILDPMDIWRLYSGTGMEFAELVEKGYVELGIADGDDPAASCYV